MPLLTIFQAGALISTDRTNLVFSWPYAERSAKETQSKVIQEGGPHALFGESTDPVGRRWVSKTTTLITAIPDSESIITVRGLVENVSVISLLTVHSAAHKV